MAEANVEQYKKLLTGEKDGKIPESIDWSVGEMQSNNVNNFASSVSIALCKNFDFHH